jgi:NADPH:quinone reductase-like Zn-dependent oxidoreductase
LDTAIDTVGGKTERELFACVRKGGTLISSVSVPDAHLAQQGGIEAKFILVDVNTEMTSRQSRISSTRSGSSCASRKSSR